MGQVSEVFMHVVNISRGTYLSFAAGKRRSEKKFSSIAISDRSLVASSLPFFLRGVDALHPLPLTAQQSGHERNYN